jgi:hypothetical protein
MSEGDARDILYPARELAKIARDAELQRQWEEREAQQSELQRLRQLQSNRPLPRPGDGADALQRFASLTELPARPGGALPRPPPADSSNLPADFNRSFSSLLSTDNGPPPQFAPPSYQVGGAPQDYTLLDGSRGSQGHLAGYPGANGDHTHSERVDGQHFGQMPGRPQPSSAYGSSLAGDSASMDMNERIRRLSTMSDHQSYQSNLQGPNEQAGDDYYQHMANMAPPSYASAAGEPSYYGTNGANGSNYGWNDDSTSNPNARGLSNQQGYADADKDDGTMALYQDYNVSEGFGVGNGNSQLGYDNTVQYGQVSDSRDSPALLTPVDEGNGLSEEQFREEEGGQDCEFGLFR